MRYEKDQPLFPISVASKMVGVTTKMLRIYEEEGLVLPHRIKNRRVYSQNDIEYISALRDLMKEGYSIASLKKLYAFIEANKDNMPACKEDFYIALSKFSN
jgi:MerR family transcriptional regulator/heat shock protein HspR